MSGRKSLIPIANIFFMLSYAWDIAPTWQKTFVDKSDYETLWELLTRLLIESSEEIFKRGLARDYVSKEEIIAGAKGRIDPGKTVRSLAWNHARTCSVFDEFEPDIAINQGIKATIYRMLKSSGRKLEKETLENLKKLYHRFGQISLVESGAERLLFSVKLQRQQRHYAFPLEICKFILANTVFNEESGKYQFLDFERDHQKLSTLFERFIFNYYKKHLTDWRVKREIIHWDVEDGGVGSEYLPEMRTDITLECPSRKMVIDAKFYQEPMKSSYAGSVKKFASANLYQLNAYLTHLVKSGSHPCNGNAEGMLLYPVLKHINVMDVHMLGHRIRVESLDLNQDWQSIGQRLEELVQ